MPKPKLQPQQTPKSILAIDARSDADTETAFAYREKHVYPYLQEQNLEITKLQRSEASRANVADEAKRNGVRFITGSGHGTETTLIGHSGEAIFEIGKYNRDEVENRIVHFMSCLSGGELGPDMVKQGALAFFGYSDELAIPEGQEKILFECDSEIDRALAEGLAVADVHERAVSLFEAYIDRLTSLADDDTAKYLTADLQCFCTPVTDSRFGDAAARLKA